MFFEASSACCKNIFVGRIGIWTKGVKGFFIGSVSIEISITMKSPLATRDRWLRTPDVAAQLGIHKNTLARYIKAGHLGEVLVLSVKDKRIRESALERFILERLA